METKLFTRQTIIPLMIGAVIAFIALWMLITPAPVSNGEDTREDKWMRVMELTDEAIANTGVIEACNDTIDLKTTRNREIDEEKADLKSQVFDFLPEQK